MLIELAIVLVLVLANGLFAGAEIAVLTTRKARLEERARQRDGRARAVAALRGQPERFLATVQIGITVISSAAAAFGGARMARDLAPSLVPAFGGYADDVAFGLVIALVSFLSLVLGELVPKSLALRYADGYALLIGRPLLALARIARPIVWFLTACSNVVLRIFGDRTSFTEARTSREELRHMVEDAGKTGAVDAPSTEIATRALELADVMVAEVMVQRAEITALPLHATVEDVRQAVLATGRSRFPVYAGDLDGAVGYVVAREVLAGGARLDAVTRPIIRVPLATTITLVLREMQARRVQIALVTDDDGSVAGLVTVQDVLEELVGELIGEHEDRAQLVDPQPDGSALVPGWLPIRQLNRALELALPISRECTTVAGLCMALALAVPPAGTKLHAADGTSLEVIDATPRRVRMVRVQRAAPAPDPSPET